MTRSSAIGLVLLAVLLTVFAQLAFRAQVGAMPGLPADMSGRLIFVLKVLTSPLVMGALVAAGVVAVCWTMALTSLPLSVAYPMLSLTFPLVVVGAHYFFGELVDWRTFAGLFLILAGITVMNVRG
jgi:multidrug transporter EmrE-like cation transporter